MPFKLNWLKDGLVVVYDGTLTDKDFLTNTKAIVADERFTNINYVIHNLLDVTLFEVSANTMEKLAAENTLMYELNTNNLKIAIVSDMLIAKGFLNIYVSHYSYNSDKDESWEYNFFETINEAVQWTCS